MLLYIVLLIIIVSAIFSYNKKIKEKFGGSSRNGPFTGWTDDEYKALFYNPKPFSQLLGGISQGANFRKLNISELQTILPKYEENFDWADGIMIKDPKIDRLQYNYIGKNIMSDVKDQGNCGCCYAFATTGVIESCYYLLKKGIGNLKELSIQQIIDCTSSSDGYLPDKPSQGCGGGDLLNIVSTYFTINRKISFNITYPYACFYKTKTIPPGSIKDDSKSIQLTNYDFTDGVLKCETVNSIKNVENYDYILIPPINTIIIDSEKYLKQAIYTYGPIYAAYNGGLFIDNTIAANFRPFQYYPYNKDGSISEYKYVTKAGIYKAPAYGDGKLNLHSLIITGWGKDKKYGTGDTFWIVKNSWGPEWGLSGFIRMSMDIKNFVKMYAIEFNRPVCNSIQTSISLSESQYYLSKNYLGKNDAYYAKIIFKAYLEKPSNKISLTIKSVFSVGEGIVPVDNVKCFKKFEELNDTGGKNIVNDRQYYYNEVNNKYKKETVQNRGLWFLGSYQIMGVGSLSFEDITDQKWLLILSVKDITNKTLSEDTLEIIWKDAVIL